MSPALAPPERGWKPGKDHAASLARLDALIARGGESAELNSLRAEVRAAAGRYSHAVEDASRAVELAPRDPRALAALARALSRTGRLEESLARFDAALAAAPGTPWLAGERALVLLALGREGALSAAAKAAAAAPGDPVCAAANAAALARAGRAEDAVAALDAARPPAKGGFGVAARTGRVRARCAGEPGRRPQAATRGARGGRGRVGRGAGRVTPVAPRSGRSTGSARSTARRRRDPWLAAWRGQLLEGAGRDEEALAALTAAVKIAPPTRPRGYGARACSPASADLDAALSDVRAAAKRPGPAFPAGTLALFEGDLLAALGKGRPAAAAYARAPPSASRRPPRACAAASCSRRWGGRRGLAELAKAAEGDPALAAASEARARLRAAREQAARPATRPSGRRPAVPKRRARPARTDHEARREAIPSAGSARPWATSALELAGLLADGR